MSDGVRVLDADDKPITKSFEELEKLDPIDFENRKRRQRRFERSTKGGTTNLFVPSSKDNI
jgi:hypothetical protein